MRALSSYIWLHLRLNESSRIKDIVISVYYFHVFVIVMNEFIMK